MNITKLIRNGGALGLLLASAGTVLAGGYTSIPFLDSFNEPADSQLNSALTLSAGNGNTATLNGSSLSFNVNSDSDYWTANGTSPNYTAPVLTLTPDPNGNYTFYTEFTGVTHRVLPECWRAPGI